MTGFKKWIVSLNGMLKPLHKYLLNKKNILSTKIDILSTKIDKETLLIVTSIVLVAASSGLFVYLLMSSPKSDPVIIQSNIAPQKNIESKKELNQPVALVESKQTGLNNLPKYAAYNPYQDSMLDHKPLLFQRYENQEIFEEKLARLPKAKQASQKQLSKQNASQKQTLKTEHAETSETKTRSESQQKKTSSRQAALESNQAALQSNMSIKDINKGVKKPLISVEQEIDHDTRITREPEIYDLHTNGNYRQLQITLNKSQTIRVNKAYKNVFVGNSEIADIVPISENLIYILGKQVGVTRLQILDNNKRIIGIIEIEVAYDIAGLESQLRKLVPDAKVKVQSINGKIFLSGQVVDGVVLQKILKLASQLAPKDAITSTISVSSPQQVSLEVRFIEANRQAGRELGIGWNVIANRAVGETLLGSLPTNQIPFGSDVGNLLTGGLPTGNTPFGTAIVRLLNNGVKADLIIQALESKNLARRLAEPTLVTMSGDTARFLAGGEFPFNVPQAEGVITQEFKKFGVGLSFTPTVLSNGLINLKIIPEVSDIIPAGNGTNVPSLTVRRAETTVELRDGQSFAIAGLLQTSNTRIQEQLPWIGNLPILGALFRSSSFQKNETDLVIIVTPRLVKPVVPGQQLETPLDNTIATNDLDFFVGGELEKPVEKKNSPYGHILDDNALHIPHPNQSQLNQDIENQSVHNETEHKNGNVMDLKGADPYAAHRNGAYDDLKAN